MMGSGKSSVGSRVAAMLGVDHVDTDGEIERRAGTTITRLFEEVGEPTFRVFEAKVVADYADHPTPLVVSTGGGAVLDAASVARMRGSGTVVWLSADIAELADRVGTGTGRPLLGDDPAGDLGTLANEREAAYRAAAHHTVDTGGRTPDEVAEDVVATCRPA